jgi:hypothetical protein
VEDVVRIFLVGTGEREICESRCGLFVERIGGEGHASKKEDGSEEFHEERIPEIGWPILPNCWKDGHPIK